MYDDDIKMLDEWFAEYTDYGTYHHTKEEDGEDVYAVSASDIELFCYYLKENGADLIGIPCMIGNDGIWFTSEDLKKAKFY